MKPWDIYNRSWLHYCKHEDYKLWICIFLNMIREYPVFKTSTRLRKLQQFLLNFQVICNFVITDCIFFKYINCRIYAQICFIIPYKAQKTATVFAQFSKIRKKLCTEYSGIFFIFHFAAPYLSGQQIFFTYMWNIRCWLQISNSQYLKHQQGSENCNSFCSI